MPTPFLLHKTILEVQMVWSIEHWNGKTSVRGLNPSKRTVYGAGEFTQVFIPFITDFKGKISIIRLNELKNIPFRPNTGT